MQNKAILTYIEKAPRPAQWGILLTLSIGLVLALEWTHLPAALLLGPMIAGIIVAVGGAHLSISPIPFWFAQGVLGCFIAQAITADIVSMFLLHWPLFISIVLAIIAACCFLGWLLSIFRFLPGATAIWGLLPGAASIMMLMADANGADGRLVMFMQYIRVIFVAMTASIIARFWFHTHAMAIEIIWFPPIHWIAFLKTMILVVCSIFLARISKFPAGFILVPLFLASIFHITGLITLELPHWILAFSFAIIGINTGLRFTRHILKSALRALPHIMLSVILLIAFCGGLAWMLVKLAGIDPLTAYLATNPGGIDSAAIIAASTKVDMSFVMSMQVIRLLILLIIGPFLARWIARFVF